MLNLFKSTNIYSKSNIDKYIFVICNNFKQNIKDTLKLLNILKPPKTLFNDYKFTNNFEKTLYV